MVALPQWIEAGVGGEQPPLSWTDLVAGESSIETVWFYSDYLAAAGADTLIGAVLWVEARESTSGQWLRSGLPVLDQRMVQLRVTGPRGGIEGLTSPWVNAGAGLPFDWLPVQMFSGAGVVLDVRIVVPESETQVDHAYLRLVVDDRDARPIPLGVAAGAPGLLLSYGDDSRPAYLFEPISMTASGSPDDQIAVGDAAWSFGGRPYSEIAYSKTASTNDGSAVPLVVGESYWLTISYGTTATWGAGDQSPGTTFATVPEGEQLWGYVEVTNVGGVVVIAQGDIYPDVDYDGALGYSELASIEDTAGLVQTYSPWRGIVGSSLVRKAGPQDITHTDDATETVWALADGTLEAAAAAPEPTALACYEQTAASGVLAAPVDLRTYQDHLDTVVHLSTTSTIVLAASLGYDHHSGNAVRYLRPNHGGLVAHLHDADPSALGWSSGSWVFAVEVLRAGSWVTLFTTGPEDRAPSIAWDATSNRDTAARAEVLDWHPGETLRATVDPSGLGGGGGTPASGASIVLRYR